jgi:exodeoxyribonuclease V alpha subunit
MLVVTPTLKAAQVASAELEAAGSVAVSAAWLVHQHGFRWDEDGHWTRQQPAPTRNERDPRARLLPGDLLLVDEAGMLDQDTAQALLVIADEQQLRVAFLGDPHQLPAVGRGGVLDHATRWAGPEAHVTLDAVHRFTDPDYAQLTLQMRTGHDPAAVFDTLHARGQIVVHPTDLERHQAVAELAATSPGDFVIADTRETVTALNQTIRDHHQRRDGSEPDRGALTARAAPSLTTDTGHVLGVGDRVATRRNDRDLDVANRDHWTITAATPDGGVEVTGRRGRRVLPADYTRQHLELAYATTAHGAQGETVDRAHLVLGDTTGAASAYVAMTRGRHHNTAHLVAESVDDARAQWVDTFGRDRADLGPAHARATALEAIDLYGPNDMSTELDHRPERPRRNAAALRPRSTEPPFGVTR